MSFLRKITSKFNAQAVARTGQMPPMGAPKAPVAAPGAGTVPPPRPSGPSGIRAVPSDTGGKAAFFLAQAKGDLDAGKLVSADTNVRLALTMNPRSAEAKALLERITAKKAAAT